MFFMFFIYFNFVSFANFNFVSFVNFNFVSFANFKSLILICFLIFANFESSILIFNNIIVDIIQYFYHIYILSHHKIIQNHYNLLFVIMCIEVFVIFRYMIIIKVLYYSLLQKKLLYIKLLIDELT